MSHLWATSITAYFGAGHLKNLAVQIVCNMQYRLQIASAYFASIEFAYFLISLFYWLKADYPILLCTNMLLIISIWNDSLSFSDLPPIVISCDYVNPIQVFLNFLYKYISLKITWNYTSSCRKLPCPKFLYAKPNSNWFHRVFINSPIHYEYCIMQMK